MKTVKKNMNTIYTNINKKYGSTYKALDHFNEKSKKKKRD